MFGRSRSTASGRKSGSTMSPSGGTSGGMGRNRPTLPTVVHRSGAFTRPFALLELLHLAAVTLRELLEELPGLLALQGRSAQSVPRVDEDVEVLDVVEVQPAGGVLDVDEVPGAVGEAHDREVVGPRGQPRAERQHGDVAPRVPFEGEQVLALVEHPRGRVPAGSAAQCALADD